MRFSHDAEADAWYFTDSPDETKIERTELLGVRHVNLDYDAEGNIVGIEVL